MRRLLTFALMAIACVCTLQAQYTTDGFYRVRNLGTERYIYITDNTGSYDMNRDQGDFAALHLIRGEEEVISDPSSIIYINKKGAESFDLQGQGTGIYKLVGRYVDVRYTSSGAFKGSYTVSATESGITKYLSDNETTSTKEGVMGTEAKAPFRNWNVFRVDATTDSYFGIKPTVQIGGKYYYPLYAPFAFSCHSSGMKVYTISVVDKELAILKELTGTIPAATPVYIECSSNQPTNNRLNILVNNATAPTDNVLRGVYFCNPKRPKSPDAITAFNPSTMRVLGVTAAGKLGFVSTSNELFQNAGKTYLPANQSYLPVPAGTPAEITIVTEKEYNEAVANRLYTLTYIVDGQTYKTLQLKAGQTITPLAAPTREGHTFSGWKGEPTVMPAQNVTVTGSFTVNSYKLTFTLDGQTFQTQTVAYGTALTAPKAPTREGYTFNGWADMPATMPARDVTVNGTYSVNSYTLTYLLEGAVFHQSKVAYGTTLTAIDEPTRERCEFLGWQGLPATMPAHDVTVTGAFKTVVFTITYMVDGTVYYTEQVRIGQPITPIAEPTREGYNFSGWQNVPSVMPEHDVTISGTFTIGTYTITYILNGAGYTDYVYKSAQYKYGAKISAPTTAPYVTGYTFNGWNDVPATMPGHDVTIYATYTANQYTITYYIDSKEYAKVSVAYNDLIVPIEAPAREGYIFKGWQGLPERMPNRNISTYGSYAIDTTPILDLREASQHVIHDLQGRRVTNVKSSGLYLVDGKKVWVIVR